MNVPYVFENELSALRILIGKELEFNDDMKFRTPTHQDLQGILITVDNWLRTSEGVIDKDERRDLRLKILSHILEGKVNTTYDLTVYQCSVLSHWLWGNGSLNEESEPGPLGERAVWFLEDCKDAVEGVTNPRQRDLSGDKSQRREKGRVPSDLSDLFASGL